MQQMPLLLGSKDGDVNKLSKTTDTSFDSIVSGD